MARPRKNPEIAASQMKSADLVMSKNEIHPKELPEPRDMKAFLGLSAEVAQDTMYVRNTRLPNGMKYFPTEPLLRTIDKFFAAAIGGPLYIDEPVTDRDVELCERKAVVMREQGLRYCYIGPDMDIQDVLNQLEEKNLGVA